MADIQTFVVSFMFATQKSTNKTPKQTNLLLAAHFRTLGRQYTPFCPKTDREPSLMNSELAEKSYRYKTNENNYNPTKKPKHPCL